MKVSNYSIVKYSSAYFNEWNSFVSQAKNATFLFHRDFMEYHQDRFEDFSLLVFHKNKLLALLPANVKGDTVYSHQGLSYGGLILKTDIKFAKVLDTFKEVLKYVNSNGFDQLEVKTIPNIYCESPSDEVNYMMFLLEAELFKSESLSVICQNTVPKFSNNRLEGVRRGVKNGLVIKEDDSFDEFWNTILVPNLKAKHNAKPVHSLDEIKNLKAKFPNNIKQFNVYYNGEIVAGTTLFISKKVVHSQYISGNKFNNELGSLDFLHKYLIKDVYTDKEYFDFGCSNVSNGKQINRSLQYWKEGFGARTIMQYFYRVNTSKYSLLDAVFV